MGQCVVLKNKVCVLYTARCFCTAVWVHLIWELQEGRASSQVGIQGILYLDVVSRGQWLGSCTLLCHYREAGGSAACWRGWGGHHGGSLGSGWGMRC